MLYRGTLLQTGKSRDTIFHFIYFIICRILMKTHQSLRLFILSNSSSLIFFGDGESASSWNMILILIFLLSLTGWNILSLIPHYHFSGVSFCRFVIYLHRRKFVKQIRGLALEPNNNNPPDLNHNENYTHSSSPPGMTYQVSDSTQYLLSFLIYNTIYFSTKILLLEKLA